MKNMKKIMAALLVMTMLLGLATTAFAATKFTDSDYALFKGSAYGYGKVTNNWGKDKKSVCIRKGSTLPAVGINKGDWTLLMVPANKGNDAELMWFNTKYLKVTDSPIKVVFSSGGSNRSDVEDQMTDSKLAGKTLKITGKTNLRKTPSLKGKSQGVAKKGKKYKLTGEVGMDNLGVVYFQIKGGKWVSAEYTNRSNYQYNYMGGE